MGKSEVIVELYSAVLEKERKRFDVEERSIIKGIKKVGEAYLPDSQWEDRQNSLSVNYEEAGYRCAYLHKYAMVHTGLFCDILEQALKIYAVKKAMHSKSISLCSLGSGPGTDIVACLFVLKEYFEQDANHRITATLIDCCEGWKSVFEAIVLELRKHVHDMVSNRNFNYEYVVANLLEFKDRNRAQSSIKGADVVTMVKFMSAAACKETSEMMETIFWTMKPGALLLFVDNAGGRFHEEMSETAKNCGMESVFGPLKHYSYKKELFNRNYCNWRSQYEAKVAVEVWKKPEDALPWNTTGQLKNQFFNGVNFTDQDFPPVDAVDHGRWELQSAYEPEKERIRLTPETEPNNRNNQVCCTIM